VQVHSSWGGGELRSALLGRFNAANMLGTLAVLLVSGVALQDALRELAKLQAVAGRMQTLGGQGQPAVVVDYAHTPDALEKVLDALREVTRCGGGKLICVFGCGGDRDPGKRPEMGAMAERHADRVYVTSDNPRSEEAQAIIAMIRGGMRSAPDVDVDRARAIAAAIHGADARDVILVAGKGHEPYQEIAGVRHPFSDLDVAKSALAGQRS
jgi:UDP-N-acetylmuramoyl-L-alanyl-D-glutamate--2,6-diaminopimelate ligase